MPSAAAPAAAEAPKEAEASAVEQVKAAPASSENSSGKKTEKKN